MSLVSLVFDEVSDVEASWVPGGSGFVVTAWEGGRNAPAASRVAIVLNDEHVDALRRALARPRPNRD